MKTKIVYALVSKPEDYYAEQLLISLESLRFRMPDAYAAILIDDTTAQRTDSIFSRISELANEIKVHHFSPEIPGKIRSRLLKTALRDEFEGNLLYIDADTIILRDLSYIDRYDSAPQAIFGVLDTHSSFSPKNPNYAYSIEACAKMGISLQDGDLYVNGGVCFMKDVPEAHDFYRDWEKNYLAGVSLGITTDQQTLEITRRQHKDIAGFLNPLFNVQFAFAYYKWKDAYILHYFSDNAIGSKSRFLLHSDTVLNRIKHEAALPPEVRKLFTDPYSGIDWIEFLRDTIYSHPIIKKTILPLLQRFYLIRLKQLSLKACPQPDSITAK